MTPADHANTDRIAGRLKACQDDVRERPYSHPVATGWYAEDVAALVARVTELTGALRQIESDIHPARLADEERPRWLHENSVWWNHYSPQEIARAALATDRTEEAA